MALGFQLRGVVRSLFTNSRAARTLALMLAVVIPIGIVNAGPKNKSNKKGLNDQALQELADAGVDKYIGDFTPISSEDVGDGWVKHTFDRESGNGPICIAGTPFSVFTRAGNPAKLLIFLQGGGGCYQDFYHCNIVAEAQEPPFDPTGIWDFESKDNPFRGFSIVYLPYCDGSNWMGDNTVFDPSFPWWYYRFHRGLRNQTAGIDLAKSMFPNASRITLAGSSAGGLGVATFAPFVVRFVYGNNAKLFVLNDGGPGAFNLNETDTIQIASSDWQFGKFYPASCTDCNDQGQYTPIVRWRLDNDATIREAFYATDGDATLRFFLNLGQPTPRIVYRDLIVFEQGLLNAAHPDRYKRFIVSDDDSHTTLRSPLFYTQEADGILLHEWADDFISPRPFWVDIVEDYVPGP